MKIDGFNSKVGASKKAGKASKAKGSAKSAKGSKSSGDGKVKAFDSVRVEDHTETLELIRNLVSDAPDVRVDEVDRIVGKIRNGQYKINFESVAEGFIREAVENELARRSKDN